jgi:hypothetical protein
VNAQKQERVSEREWEQGLGPWNERKWGEPERVMVSAAEPGKGTGEARVKDCGTDRAPENEEEREMGRWQVRAKQPERATEPESDWEPKQ